MNKLSIFLILTLVLAFLMIPTNNSVAEEEPPPPMPEEPTWRVEGIGTNFEVTGSDYLDVTLSSSETIQLYLESIPETILMKFTPVSEAVTAQITLSGLASNTTYYKTEDNIPEHVVFTSDANGSYSFQQDLSQTHIVFILTQPSTKYIYDNSTGGHCTYIGVWNWSTKTCTLNQDVTETIRIMDDGITLDGAGHKVIGSKTGVGIAAFSVNGLTVQNLVITGFSYGIWARTNNSTIDGNETSGHWFGMNLDKANNNLLENNTASGNTWNGIVFQDTCNDNILTGNVANSNPGYGFVLSGNFNSNNVSGNTANSNGNVGFSLYNSTSNIISGNTANSNRLFGFMLYNNTNSNTVSGNTASSSLYGILINNSSWNTITKNLLSNNSNMGLYLYNASNNQVYNNNFISNPTQARVYSGTGNLFHLEEPTGGNYWDDFDTPAEGCNDDNADEFCDTPYVFYGGQDDLPWTSQDAWLFDFNGFFQPVDNLPTYNKVKAGSSVPVKFSLSGDQGLDIMADGYPKSQEIACDTGGVIDDIEETSTAGNSSLSYDPEIDQYNYIWKTEKTWAGTCRQLVVMFIDGAEYYAYFTFK